VEIVTRFLTIVALGELRARLEGNPLPAALLDKLQPFIERPTFGAWRELLRTVCESLDHAATLVVSALPQFVVKDLLPALSADPRTPETNLIELRNRSVHGGALTTADAQLYLAIWSPWLSSLAERLAFFNNVEVCHYAAGRASRLIGPNARASELALRPELIQVFAALGLDGHVLMLHSGRFLDLWPLCDYGRASSTSLAGNRTSKADAPLVFYRADRDRLLYAALGVDLSQGERPDAVAEFRDLFQLDARQPDLRSVAVTDYEDELRTDAQLFVGRVAQLRQAKNAIKSVTQGVLWISGPPGIGKSYMMARLAEDLRGDPRKGRLRIAWRFKASDIPRCSRGAFFRHAISQLADWLDRKDVTPASDTAHLYDQLDSLLRDVSDQDEAKDGPPRRVLFVLDGLDEIVRSDVEFQHVPFRLSLPHVIWLCAGRPDLPLLHTFATDRCTHVFPTEHEQYGLPPMSHDDIRGMLLDSTGAFKYDLLARDRQSTAALQITNDVVDAIVERAAGLPLYVRLVVQDVIDGTFVIANLASTLPRSLNEYYDELMRRLSIGELQAMLTPLAVTICHAHAPLDLETLLALMTRRRVLRRGDDYDRALLARGLEAIRNMVRVAGGPEQCSRGYEPYHETLREYVLRDERGLIGVQNDLATDDLCSLASDWHLLEATSCVRKYALRHGLAHLLKSQRWDSLYALLTHLTFWEAVNAEGVLFSSVAELRASVARWPTHTVERRHQKHVLSLLHAAISSDTCFIHDNRHSYPQGLFQCVWNYVSWHGNAHVNHTRTEHTACESSDAAVTVSILIESWRTAKEVINPGFIWLRSLRPPSSTVRTSRVGVLRGHNAAVTGVVYSSDGKNIVSTSADGTIRVWDALSHEPLSKEDVRSDPVNPLTISVGGVRCRNLRSLRNIPRDIDTLAEHSVAVMRGGNVQIWSLHASRLTLLSQKSLPDISSTYDVDASGRLWIGTTTRSYGRASEWTEIGVVATEGKTPSLCNPVGLCFFMADIKISPSGRWAASVGREKQVDVWDVEQHSRHCRLRGHNGWTTSVAFASDESLLASGGAYGEVRLWDLAAQKKVANLNGHTATISALAFSPDNSWLASSAKDGAIRVWDVSTKSEVCCLKGHSGIITSLAFSPDGMFIASASHDATIQIWEVSNNPKQDNTYHEESLTKVMSMAVSPCGSKVASGHLNGDTCIWDASLGSLLFKIPKQPGVVRALAFTENGKQLVTGLRPFTVIAEHENDDGYYMGKSFQFFHEEYEHGVISSRFDYLRKKGQGRVCVWDVDSGRCLEKWAGHEYGVRKLVVSVDDRVIWSLGFDKEALKWHRGIESPISASIEEFECAAQKSEYLLERARVRAVKRLRHTVVEDAESHQPIAYWPEQVDFAECPQNGHLVVGAVDNSLCLLVLEGKRGA